MRSSLFFMAGAILAYGCSSTGSAPPPAAPAPKVETPPAPVKIIIQDLEPEPLPDVRCDLVIELAGGGDHKPAADEMGRIETTGSFCHDEALQAAQSSRNLVAEADAWIHSSTRKKQDGDVAGAREDLRRAIEIYPKYYWAKKLLRDLGGDGASKAEVVARQEALAVEAEAPEPDERPTKESKSDVEADVEVIRQLIAEQNLELARIAEQEGDLEAASRWAITAIRAEPEDGELKKSIVEYARLLGLKFFSAGELSPAREIWGAAIALDESDARLREYLRQVDERLANLEQIRSSGSN